MFFRTIWKLIDSIPLLTPIILATFGIVITGLLLIERLNNKYLLLLSAVIVLPIAFYAFISYKSIGPGSQKEKNVISLLFIIFAICWTVFNIQHASQNVFIDRDPGFYNVASKWLKDHESTNVKVDRVFGNSEEFQAQEGGMWAKAKQDKSAESVIVQPQGMHLFPALAGIASRIVGDSMITRTNVILGGLALIAFYGFARLFLRPRWAAVSGIILGFTMPMIYFSRDTYTEPLSLLFVFGGLATFWHAYNSLPAIRKPLWVLSGLVAGSAALTRADGYFTVIACLMALILIALFSNKKLLRAYIRSSLLFLIGAMIPIILAWFDMTKLSTAYFNGHGPDVKNQLILLGFVLFLGLLTVVFREKIISVIRKNKLLGNINYAWVLSGLLLAGFLVLLSRPFWWRKIPFLEPLTYDSYGTNHSVSVVQKTQGMAIEKNNYSHNTIEWIEWYIGAVLVVLAIIGSIIMIHKIIEKQRLQYLPVVILLVMTSFAFFVLPSITADQVWASRRFLPVIMPGFIILGVYGASKLFGYLSNNIKLPRFFGGFLFLAISSFLMLIPLRTSYPLLNNSERGNLYHAFTQFCDVLPDNAAILWIDRSTLALSAVQTSRSYCGVDSLGYTYSQNRKDAEGRYIIEKDHLSTAATEARKRGLVPLLAMRGNRAIEVDPRVVDNMSTIIEFHYRELEKTLINPPGFFINQENSLMLGRIQADGSIKKY